jgi:hypothetical protein
MRRALIGQAIVAVALLGCDGTSDPSSLCDTQVTMSVTNGTVPQFAWTESCLVQRVQVLVASAPSVGGPRPIWGIEWAGGIAAPVRYGEAPFGAQVLLPAEPLISGASYLVEVSMIELVGNSTIVGRQGFVR